MANLLDMIPSGILSYRQLAASSDVVDKSPPHLNSLFEKYIQKHGKSVSFILIACIYCSKSKAHYNSFFDASEMKSLEEMEAINALIEVGYYAIYDKTKYANKKEVLRAYEEQNFVGLLTDRRVEIVDKDKETQKIKKVWVGDKDKDDGKGTSQGQSNETNFLKNNNSKGANITSFFKKPK